MEAGMKRRESDTKDEGPWQMEEADVIIPEHSLDPRRLFTL